MRSLTLAALVAATLTAAVARAEVVDSIALTYYSGATFNGTLVLSNDLSSITSLNGTLAGYDPNQFGFYGGSVTDPVSVTFPFNVAAPSPGIFFTTVTGGSFGYYNFLDFGYAYDSSGITLTAFYNDVDQIDPLVSASVTSVPEPGTVALLALGLLGLAATQRRRLSNPSLG